MAKKSREPAAAPPPPRMHERFRERYPELAQAWELAHHAGEAGPLDARTARLVRLAVAIGAMREGAFHASVRKALAQGIPRAEIEQVIALASGTIGFPAAVAAFSWLDDASARSE